LPRTPPTAPTPHTVRPTARNPHTRLRHLHAGTTREGGSLSLELSVLAPVVMLILFMTIQAGLYFFARDVAVTAAQQGVEAARVQGGTLAEGEARTQDLLTRSGGSITGADVSGTSGALVQITVTGHVATWIPGLSLSLSQTATGVKEETGP
jgi:Flp pilus assembly protein TadG